MAIVVAVLAMLMMSALGAALALTTASEMAIAANFRSAQQGLYAADAAVGLAMDSLGAVGDWSRILEGVAQSAFVDGPPQDLRKIADGSSLSLDETLNRLNCGKATGCSPSELAASTPSRPWGPNNPVWRLFAYGPLPDLMANGHTAQTYYILALVADDPSENDGDPFRDGQDAVNPGSGILLLRGEAFGPRGTHQVVEVTVTRAAEGTGPQALRILSWRQLTR